MTSPLCPRMSGHRAQLSGQSQAGLGAVGIGDAERQRGADVVELHLDPVKPAELVRAAQTSGGGLDQGEVMIAMGDAAFAQAWSRPQREAFGGVVANRLKQPVAGRTVDYIGLDQALADQRGHQVEHLPVGDVIAGGDRFARHRVQAPAKTDSRSNTVRSCGLSRSYDQSMRARRVWWRGSAVRLPVVSSRNR